MEARPPAAGPTPRDSRRCRTVCMVYGEPSTALERRNSMKRWGAAFVLPIAVLAGCASGSEPLAEPGSSTTDSCVLDDVGYDAVEFVGLSEDVARSRAADRDLLFNVLSRDDSPCEPVLADVNRDRLNVELRGGVVVAAARF